MPWRRMGEWEYRSTWPDLGTRRRWFVSFKPRPLYPRGKSLRYSIGKGLSGPHIRSARYGEVEILDITGTRTPSVVQKVVSRYTDYATATLNLTQFSPQFTHLASTFLFFTYLRAVQPHFSNMNCVLFNDGLLTKIVNWTGCRRECRVPNLKYYPSICLDGLSKTTKVLNPERRSLGRDLKFGTFPTRSFKFHPFLNQGIRRISTSEHSSFS
jgi:hypothetical protein